MSRRIAFALPSVIGGGAERVTLHILQHLDKQRFEPILLLGSQRGELRHLVPNDIDVIETGGDTLMRMMPGMIRALRYTSPSIAYGTLGLGWGFAMVRGILGSVSIVERLGNTLGPFYKDVGRTTPTRSSMLRGFHRLGYELADVTVCQSDFMVRDACLQLEVDGVRFRRIYNPVVPPQLRSDIKITKTVVAVGNLHWRKGFDLLIRAWALVETGDYHLVILGEGSERQELEELVSALGLVGSVHLVGYVDDPSLIVSESLFLISPSRYEGLANVLLESLAAGTPVVATDCPSGNREIIVDGVNGTLVETSVAGLVAGLGAGFKHAAKWRQQFESWNIQKNFTMGVVMRQWHSLFDELGE